MTRYGTADSLIVLASFLVLAAATTFVLAKATGLVAKLIVGACLVIGFVFVLQPWAWRG